MQKFSTKKLVGLALFTAIVIVLQLLGSFIRFGVFSISLVLIPIVVGAAVYGPVAGAWLGFVFGGVVLLSGDANFFLTYSIFGTILTVLVKGTAAGYCAGLVYRLFEKKSKYAAGIAAAIICPVVNSGIFFLGCLAFFVKAIEDMGGGGHMVSFIVLTLIGGNFLFELLFNVVLSSVVLRVIQIGKKSIEKKA